MFLEKTLELEQAGSRHLEGYAADLDRLDVDVAREMDAAGANEVRIMTAHGAKGLEAPIVILPDMTFSDAGRSGLVRTGDGTFLWLGSSDEDCEAQAGAREDRGRESKRELSRLLYVGLTRARDRLILCNMRLVWSIAGRRQREGTDIQDLVQEGSIGLARAAELFDPEMGYRFTTYATWWIRQSISNAVLSDSPVRVPLKVAGALPRAVEWAVKFRRENGREPTDQELIQRFRLTAGGPGLLRKAAIARRVSSLDSLTESGTPLQELVADEDPQALPDAMEVQSQVDLIARAMPNLGPLAAAIVTLQLDGWNDQAIATRLGMPRKDVSANIRRSVDVLRELLAEHDAICGAVGPSVAAVGA